MNEKTNYNYDPYGNRKSEEAREHFHAAREEFMNTFKSFVPPEFREHGRNARREMLLAWRSMIDATIARMDEANRRPATPTTPPTPPPPPGSPTNI